MDLSSRLGFALVSFSLPIGLCGEHAGPAASIVALGKICQSWCLEEGEVVTRFL